MDFIQEFSQAVREHRKRKHLTLEQMAEKAQVSVSTTSRTSKTEQTRILEFIRLFVSRMH